MVTAQTPSVTLKGAAMLAAIDAGMVPRMEQNGKSGYDISAFTRFWEKFSPALDKSREK